ncbi:permease-like cell division protein FtsX [Pasteuria penetrans]|uniref:permease-like cell division protein FtsX n=1 Tax=Pasteuria penetrans TaxID=86005 RepID=UPI000FB6CD82|nr:permease-like cell division protein FtsX [Pasteuria penetrans]
MTIEGFRRHMREAVRGIKSNAWMSFAAVSAVSITLFTFGIFFLIARNLTHILEQVREQFTVKVELRPGVSPEDRETLQGMLSQRPDVGRVTFESREMALKKTISALSSQGERISYLDDFNPMYDTFLVQPSDPHNISGLTQSLRDNAQIEPWVNDVAGVNGGGVIENIDETSRYVSVGILVFFFVLALLTCVLISNTIRLTIMARRREIEIQRLVGASNGFIRWPFLLEGAILGCTGAIFPSTIVLGLYSALLWLSQSLALFFQWVPVMEIAPYLVGVLFGIGVFVGILGSMLSVHRFLRI